MSRNYDEKCLELVEHFAQGEDFTDAEKEALAEQLQDTVELFIGARGVPMPAASSQ